MGRELDIFGHYLNDQRDAICIKKARYLRGLPVARAQSKCQHLN